MKKIGSYDSASDIEKRIRDFPKTPLGVEFTGIMSRLDNMYHGIARAILEPTMRGPVTHMEVKQRMEEQRLRGLKCSDY